MKYPRSSFSTVYLKGYIYAIGGETKGNKLLKACERYNLERDEWEEIAKLNHEAISPACCSYQDSCIFKFANKFKMN